jgi:hypothetical protein
MNKGNFLFVNEMVVVLFLCHAAFSVTITPAPGTTLDLAFDTLKISPGPNLTLPTFLVSAPEFNTVSSEVWSIDGAGLPDGVVLQTSGYFSQLGITYKIVQHLSTGLHRIEATVYFTDTTITASWYFKLYETTYSQSLARLVIEPNGFLRVISQTLIDTSLFTAADAVDNNMHPLVTRYAYTAANLGKVSDTIHHFILQTSFGNGQYFWRISGPYSSFLHQTEPLPPHQIKTALRVLQTKMADNSRKLGPVFPPAPWYPDRLVAYNDSTYWYFSHHWGGGDCQAGCTYGGVDVYRVSYENQCCVKGEGSRTTGLPYKDTVWGNCTNTTSLSINRTANNFIPDKKLGVYEVYTIRGQKLNLQPRAGMRIVILVTQRNGSSRRAVCKLLR